MASELLMSSGQMADSFAIDGVAARGLAIQTPSAF